MDEGGLWIYIILLLFLIFTNAFFAMSEIAIISLNDGKIKKMASSGDKKAKKLMRFIDDPSRFLATIQIGVTISGFLASAVAADTFTEYIVAYFSNYNINIQVIRVVSLIVITLLLSYFTLVFGELVPKRLAMHSYEKISFRITNLLSFIYKIERPLVFLLSVSTNGVLRLFGINPNEKPEEVTEEEIRMMVDVGNESGTIEQIEKDMIHNVFEFDDKLVDEIMTHRTEITAVEIDTPIEEVINTALEEGYSRIPVYEDVLDNIVGVLYVKDLLKLVLSTSTEGFEIKNYMRKALFIPDTNKCKDLFQEFQKTKIQMAVIVDEYGGTSGIVTMEDLLESIVGNIQDEYDDEEEEFTQISDTEFIIDGMYSLDKIERQFDIKFEENEEDYDYDTISGYITGKLGKIPSKDEHPVMKIENVEFTVVSVEEHRITKVKAVILPIEDFSLEDTDSKKSTDSEWFVYL